jgi:hypothetical protein
MYLGGTLSRGKYNTRAPTKQSIGTSHARRRHSVRARDGALALGPSAAIMHSSIGVIGLRRGLDCAVDVYTRAVGILRPRPATPAGIAGRKAAPAAQ